MRPILNLFMSHIFALNPEKLLNSATQFSSFKKDIELSPRDYLQVEYLNSSVYKLSADSLRQHQKSKEQEAMGEYLDEVGHDSEKYHHFKHTLKTKFFKIRSHPRTKMISENRQPHELIKKFSVQRQDQQLSMAGLKQSVTDLPRDYSLQFRALIASSREVSKVKSEKTSFQTPRLISSMQQERKEIIKKLQESLGNSRLEDLEEISNKEKYSLDYVSYLKVKTKAGIQKIAKEQKLKDLPMDQFQDVLLRWSKLGRNEQAKLENIFTRVRRSIRRGERVNEHELPLKQSCAMKVQIQIDPSHFDK